MVEDLQSLAVAKHLSALAKSLSSEPDHQQILERVVDAAMELLRSDAGTLYLHSDGALKFSVIRNSSLGLHESSPDLKPIQLFNEKGELSHLVVAHAFVENKTINIPDAQAETRFDFSDTHRFDQQFGYNSHSFLCVPLVDHEHEVIGVLQLINALDKDENVIAFPKQHEALLEALGGIAATVVTQRQLIDAQRDLFESFIRLIAEGIDYKSPVTGRHCQQVPEVALLMAEGVCAATEGPFAEVQLSDQEMYELKIAAWLHDCGKITTPEAVIEKGKKLETVFDRIELVASRVRELQQHLWIEALSEEPRTPDTLAACKHRIQALDDDFEFLKQINTGGEFMSEADAARLHVLSGVCWVGIDGEKRCLLTEDELKNLSISKGTLLPEEIEIMRDHIRVTDRMLSSLVYPRSLHEVADIAVNHHEHLDGTGYPKGLKAEQLSLRARIMCIADVFEALTAPDRPYKPGMKLSQALSIIGKKVEAGQLDGPLFDMFVKEKVYRQYADRFMPPHQIDEPDLSNLPGYRGY